MKLNIHHIRLGFATNSSSYHTVLILDKNSGWIRDFVLREDSRDPGWWFSESLFILNKKEWKLRYLAAQLLLWLSWWRDTMSNKERMNMVRKITGVEIPDGQCVGVDHASAWAIPCLPGTKLRRGDVRVNLEFIKDLTEFLGRENVAILGDPHDDCFLCDAVYGRGIRMPFILEECGNIVLARYDKKYHYWALFGPETGTKVRMSFDSPKLVVNPDAASIPEQIDLKITGYCEKGCSWCYQGSTTRGRHGDAQVIGRVIEALGQLGVFEVVLGGGEPIRHPKLKSILSNFKTSEVQLPFGTMTTRDYSILDKPSLLTYVLRRLKCIAFSCNSMSEITELMDKIKSLPHDVKAKLKSPCWERLGKLAVQVIVGVTPQDEFKRIVSTALDYGLRVTLLGYKPVGRGGGFKPHVVDWKSVLRELSYYCAIGKVGVDTILANQITDEDGFVKQSYNIKEGTHSAYIDATCNNGSVRMYPSSFSRLDEGVDIKVVDGNRLLSAQMVAESIKNAFETFVDNKASTRV